MWTSDKFRSVSSFSPGYTKAVYPLRSTATFDVLTRNFVSVPYHVLISVHVQFVLRIVGKNVM